MDVFRVIVWAIIIAVWKVNSRKKAESDFQQKKWQKETSKRDYEAKKVAKSTHMSL